MNKGWCVSCVFVCGIVHITKHLVSVESKIICCVCVLFCIK